MNYYIIFIFSFGLVFPVFSKDKKADADRVPCTKVEYKKCKNGIRKDCFWDEIDGCQPKTDPRPKTKEDRKVPCTQLNKDKCTDGSRKDCFMDGEYGCQSKTDPRPKKK